MSVKSEKENCVGMIVIDHPPVNALSQSVAEGILVRLAEFEAAADVRSIVITATGRTFVAGADVSEFLSRIEAEDFERGARLHDLTNRIEGCSKPVVCGLFGTTLGGGLELAMACHYRIAMPGTRVGQPEVRLGLIPGAGGTQRLPRLCGIVKAAELCAFGEMVGVVEARELGVVDEIAEGDLRVAEIKYARRVSNDGPRRTCDRNERLVLTPETQTQLDEIRRLATEKFQGAQAGGLAVDAVEKSAELAFEDGLAIENDLFIGALASEEARNLIQLFFAERKASKVEFLDLDTEFLVPRSAGFLQLFSDDVHLVQELIRADMQLRIVDRRRTAIGDVDFFCIREAEGDLLGVVEPDCDSTIILVTAETFQAADWKARGFLPANVVGIKYWPHGSRFCEIGISEETSAFALRSVIELVKKLGCAFVVEKPAPFYASQRIKEHRFDESDLQIEVWKLLNENVIQRASDVDLIQVHCFGHPRHRSNVGWKRGAES
ncbi:MAG: enoyl-CoA hydratase-related protein [Planctomycetota bacterium]|nr:enoyl-CoA hydratase-related protein [Planctomycetota bacterium]